MTEEMQEMFQPMYDLMAKDISKQSKRLGGKMAVAQAIYSRKQRDSMRKILGSKCVFIVLNMSRECQKKRVIARHGEDNEDILNMLIKFAELYEPAGEDEENAFNLEITEDMNREDVIQKILEIEHILPYLLKCKKPASKRWKCIPKCLSEQITSLKN